MLKEFQLSSVEPKKLSLEHSANIYPKGIFVEIANRGGLYYNFAQEKISYKDKSQVLFKVSTKNKSIHALGQELMQELKTNGIDITIKAEKIENKEILTIDNSLAKDVALTFWKLYSGLARVKAGILGTVSPLVLWTHHFDMAFLYFVTEKLTESDPTIAFGFSPQSDGIPRPYAYMYAWDGKAYVELEESDLFEKSQLWDKGWKGVFFSYDEMLTFQDPIKQFEDFYRHFFKAFREKM
jgi:hypothetical protein